MQKKTQGGGVFKHPPVEDGLKALSHLATGPLSPPGKGLKGDYTVELR